MKTLAVSLIILLLASSCATTRYTDPANPNEPTVKSAVINPDLARAPLIVLLAPLILPVSTIVELFRGPEKLPGGDCQPPHGAPPDYYFNCLSAQVDYLNKKPSWRFAAWVRRHILGESGTQGR